MLNLRRLSVIAFVVSVTLAGGVPAARADAPTEALRQSVDQVIRVLEQPGDHRAEVRKVANGIFDFQETAKRALGRHWAQRTPQEQKEFTQLFADLLEKSYLGKIELYHGEKVAWNGDTVNGDDATVRTKILTKQGTEIPVDYRMQQKDGRWLVYDVNIEGVSLVANYRTQFNKIIQTESYRALVEKLRAKDAQPAASPARERR
jgi:phospholipid transport system substrate-binding protein